MRGPGACIQRVEVEFLVGQELVGGVEAAEADPEGAAEEDGATEQVVDALPQVEAAGRDLAARGEHGGVGAEDEIVAEDDVERGVGVERRANRAECAGQVLFVGVEPAEDVATRGDGVVEAAAERVVHAGIGGSPVVAAERGGDVLARYRGGRAFADEVGAGDFGALRLDGGRARLESGARVENRRDNSEFQGFAIVMA